MTPTVAVAAFVPSAILVAVIVTTPADAGAVKVTEFPEVLVAGEKDPPPLDDQLTPWLPVSFVSVALTERVCEVTNPPRLSDPVTVMFDPPEPDVVAVAVLE